MVVLHLPPRATCEAAAHTRTPRARPVESRHGPRSGPDFRRSSGVSLIKGQTFRSDPFSLAYGANETVSRRFLRNNAQSE